MTTINFKKVQQGASLFALLAAAAVFQGAVKNLSTSETALVPEPPKYVGLSIDPRIVKRFLGVRLLVSDLIWIDTLIKADVAKEKQSFTSLYQAFKTIVNLNPDNAFAYFIGGLQLSVIKDDIKGATELLREGALHFQQHPSNWDKAWQVPFLLGFNLIYEEHELDEGSKWVKVAAAMKGAPFYVTKLGEMISSERGRLEVASRLLLDFYRRLENADQKKIVEKKMVEVSIQLDLVDLNEKYNVFLKTTEAFAFSKKKAFILFLRSINRAPKDILGRAIHISDVGKIELVGQVKK